MEAREEAKQIAKECIEDAKELTYSNYVNEGVITLAASLVNARTSLMAAELYQQ
jgi:hypothetical protein